MGAQGYMEYIQNQIRIWPANIPITTAAVVAGLASFLDIEIESAKKITNVYLKRLTDKGELIRIQKGVYGKAKETPYGKLMPNADELTARLLMCDGENIIGYIAGPTLLNTIGLCSWMPREYHIATNRYRRRLPTNTLIRVYKPFVTVTNENASYLQALEVFTALEKYPIDSENSDEIIRSMLRRNRVNNEKLIWYARTYCGQKTLLKTIDVALEEPVK